MNNRRVKLTKRILKETLIEELKTHSLSQVSVKSLCEKADLNRSTFYAHYMDIYELFDEIENEFLSHIAFLTPDMSRTKKLSLITEYVSYTYTHKDTFFALVNNGHFLRKFKDFSLTHHDELRADSNKTPNLYFNKLLTAYTVTGSVSLLREWLEEPAQTSPEVIAELILALSNHAEKLTFC